MSKQAEMETKPRTQAAEAQEEISLLDLIIVIVRWRWRIAWTTLGFTLAAIVIALLLPVRYTATTSILPPQQGSSAGSALLAQLGGLSSLASMGGGGAASLGLKNPADMQVALMKSRTVEDAMISRFKLASLYHARNGSEARKKLEKWIEIDAGLKDGLIRVAATDRDARRAADLANGYIEEFRKSTASLAVTEASQRRLFFEQQLAHAKDDLASAEEELKKTEQTTGLIQVDSQARAVIQSVAQLRGQIAAKEVQIRGLRSFATDDNPDLQVAEQELSGLRAELGKMGASGDSTSNALPIPRGNMQESSLAYIRKLRDVKYYETIFDLLARQYEVAKVDEARQGTMVQVVDRAVVPDTRSFPKRTYLILGGAVLGLLLGVVRAFASEGLRRLANDPAERARLDTLGELTGRRPKPTRL